MERDLAIEEDATDPSQAGAPGAEPSQQQGHPDRDDQPGSDETSPDQVDPASPAAIEAVDALLDEVEQALGRIDAGVYGRCQQCGGVIDDALLSAVPTARTCDGCPPPPD